MSTLYDKLGGEPAIDAAVDIFYVKVLADDRIKHFFEGIDMDKMRDHQKKFLTFAFGGPSRYSGRSMGPAHARLVEEMGLNDTHFDAVIENLGATLVELNVPEELINEAAGIALSVRDDVLGRAPA
ncbi:MAG: group 1 truncated hemoglobin [Verrucomicrobiota bacterium]